MNQIVIELKSEALKERHWKQMMKQLRVNWTLTDLTLGQVWDADLVRHEAAIKDIMLVAQGEMALEEFLKQVCSSFPFISAFITIMFFRCANLGKCTRSNWSTIRTRRSSSRDGRICSRS